METRDNKQFLILQNDDVIKLKMEMFEKALKKGAYAEAVKIIENIKCMKNVCKSIQYSKDLDDFLSDLVCIGMMEDMSCEGKGPQCCLDACILVVCGVPSGILLWNMCGVFIPCLPDCNWNYWGWLGDCCCDICCDGHCC